MPEPLTKASRRPLPILRARCAPAGLVRLVLALAFCLDEPAGASIASEQPARQPQTHALLLNGGGSGTRNYLSHLHHLQDMVGALRNRGIPLERIHIFSADGEEPGKDLAGRGVEPADFWLISATSAGRVLNPSDSTNTVWEGMTLRPTRLRELRVWFAGMRDTLQPGDTLIVFVTDHGTRNTDDPDNGFISLWNESLSVLELRALLGYLQPGVRVVSVMSQCYSGAFADAMAPLHSRLPGGNVCGFYSTMSDRPAYGCYPEGRDRDRIGHAFRFIDAMGRHASMDDVHAAVLIIDTSPDVPLRTSDILLERLVADEAALRKVEMEGLVDGELALAWKRRGEWEPQIRLLDRIGEVYGTFSPRSLGELKPRIDSLQSLSSELDTYEDRWRLALDDLRKDNLDRFQEQQPAWKERLDEKKVESLDPQTRSGTLRELLGDLKEFTMGRADVWTRLQDLHGKDEGAKSAKFRADVRLAALMRMRALLVRVAGIQLLSQVETPLPDTSDRPGRLSEMKGALAALRECESFRIGALADGQERPPTQESPEPLPPFDEDLAAVSRALPSWLGIRFHPVTSKQRESFELQRGAAIVEQVYPDGPAGAAGLRAGDIVLGPPSAHFSEPNRVREWTMTSPRDTPLVLDALRDGKSLQVTVELTPYPTRLPELPAPLKIGDQAPGLGSLRLLPSGFREAARGARAATTETTQASADLTGRHMLFFWATWCVPCKNSLPELTAWSKKTGVPVLAVSDEDEQTVRKFLESWTGPFPDLVASDELRTVLVSYGVSGTPTFVLVDENGKVGWRQVGYTSKDRLSIPDWSWSGHQK